MPYLVPDDHGDLPISRSVTVAGAAEILDCDPTMIRRLLARGELEGHRLGKRGVRILVDSIGAYQRRNAIAPTVGRPNGPRRMSPGHRAALRALKKAGIL